MKTIDEVMSQRLEVLGSKALHNYCLVFTLPFMCAKHFMILSRELLPATVKLPSRLFSLRERRSRTRETFRDVLRVTKVAPRF